MDKPKTNETATPAIDHLVEAMLDAQDREGEKAIGTLDEFIARREAHSRPQTPDAPPPPAD